MKDAHTNLSVLLGYVLLLSMFYSSPTTAATSQQTGADGRGVTVTEQNNGQTVAVSMHDTLVVRLQTQMGTGYGWHILKTNGRRLKLLSGPDLESAPGGQPGGVEHQVFRFKALRPGISILDLGYVRPWEKNTRPLKSFRLKVRVR